MLIVGGCLEKGFRKELVTMHGVQLSSIETVGVNCDEVEVLLGGL